MVSPVNHHIGIRFIIGGIAAAIALLIFSGNALASGVYVPPTTDTNSWTSQALTAASADLENIPVATSGGGYTPNAYASLFQMAEAAGTDDSLSVAAGAGVGLGALAPGGVAAVALWTYDGIEIYRLFTNTYSNPPGASGQPCYAIAGNPGGACANVVFAGSEVSTWTNSPQSLGVGNWISEAISTNYRIYCDANKNCYGAYPGTGAYISLNAMNGNVMSDPAGTNCGVTVDSSGGHCFEKWTTVTGLLGSVLQESPMTAQDYSNFAGSKSTLSSSHKIAQIPTGNLGATTVQKALTIAHCETPSSQSEQDTAGCSAIAQDSGVTTGYNIPNCVGQTFSQCETLYSSAGFTGAVVPTQVGTDGANVTYPADAIIEQAIAPNTNESDPGTELDVTENPDAGEMPLSIPAPDVNETYSDYVSRLQALGYLGTITEVDLTDATGDESMGPDAIARVSITTGTLTGSVYYPLAWPSTNPTIAASDSITLYKNPPDYSPAPTATGTGTSGEPGNCSDCSIDWTPIEGLNFGSAFPFGLPGWISSFFGNFNQSGTCPTLSIGKPDVLGGGTEDVSFCSSDWENTWRPIVFPVLEALMTAAGVVFFATKILGYGNADS